MDSRNAILALIKDRVQQVVPGAAVFLFGSRVYGIPTEESDWDILVLTRQPVSSELKKNIHSILFPVSVQISAFINTLILQDTEWKDNPAYYSLHQSVDGRMIGV
ncbi:MAG: nucleotidyltransferase domain-containing protein [Sediminibacterium sp.]